MPPSLSRDREQFSVSSYQLSKTELMREVNCAAFGVENLETHLCDFCFTVVCRQKILTASGLLALLGQLLGSGYLFNPYIGKTEYCKELIGIGSVELECTFRPNLQSSWAIKIVL